VPQVNNRFVKNNIGLLAVTSVCSLIALVVLIFVIIESIEMGKNSAKVKEMRDKIQEIIKQNPAPVEGNKPLIKQDIEIYRRAAAELQSHFGTPLEPALDEFFKVLKLRKDREMWKEEFGDEPVPDQITRQRFVDVFRKKWDGIEPGNYAKQRYEFNEFRRSFANWDKALEVFVKAAQPCMVEPLNRDNSDEVLMAALGFPRRMDGDPRKLRNVLEGTREQLLKDLNDQIQIAPSAAGLGFGQLPEAGMQGQGELTFAPDDYPFIVRHLDIVCDMLRRIRDTGIKCVYDIRIRRGGGGEGGDGDGAVGGEAGRFNSSFETVGGYEVSHYQLEVSGSMESIRKFAETLDKAYPQRRVYIIKSIFLYAEENGAERVFSGADKEEPGAANPAQPAAQQSRRSRRSRRSRAADVGEDNQGGQNEADAERQRRLEEARRLYRERQARLPYDKRDGYGEVLVGAGDTYRAVVDIDYVARSGR